MNMHQTIKLKKVPFYDDDEVITTHADGSPLSYIYSEKWDFSGVEVKAVGKNSIVSFRDTDSEFRAGIQSTLGYICKQHKIRHKTLPSSNQVQAWKRGLERICTALKSCRWAALSDDRSYKLFKNKLVRNLKQLGIGESTVSDVTTALNLLNSHDLCRREVDGKELKRLASTKEGEQAIAIPIAIYQAILTEAIKSVEKYHSHRRKIARVMRDYYAIVEEEKADTTKSQKAASRSRRVKTRVSKIKHNIPDFTINYYSLSNIMTSCALVTMAFSGVRVGELLSFSKSSYKHKVANGKDVPTLQGETSKGEDGIPRTVTWQTHPIAKDALELAFDITQPLRELYKDRIDEQLSGGSLSPEKHSKALREINCAFICTDHSLVTTSYVQNNLSRSIGNLFNTMAATQLDVDEFNNLNPTRFGQLKVGGSLPKLSPHDFRRTFAVFFRRYGFGSASTIKFQYKHDNINMSDYYANNATLQAMEDILLDVDLLKIMNEEGINMAVDIFDEIYNESETLSGLGGERIAKDKYQKLKDGHKVYFSRTELETLIREGSLSVVKLPSGLYCLNPSCSRLCGIGQFSGGKKPCDHEVVTEKQAKKILRQNNRLIETFRGMNTGDPLESSMLIGLKQKIKLNEITIEKHNLKFEAFNDDVKGIIVTQGV